VFLDGILGDVESLRDLRNIYSNDLGQGVVGYHPRSDPGLILGPIIWPRAEGGPIPFLLFLNLVQATVLGLGVSFVAFGLPVMRRISPGSKARAWAMYLSIAYLMISWWPLQDHHQRTFTQSQGILIPASLQTEGPGSPYPSKLSVGGLESGRIKDVDLKLAGFFHDYPENVDMLQVSPSGKKAFVMSDVGGGTAVNNIDILLNDSSFNVLPDNDALVSGTYFSHDWDTTGFDTDSFDAPAPAPGSGAFLSNFNGTNPNGTWTFFVMDDTSDKVGILDGWSLRIKARVRR
jgi:hypothetical protein